MENKNNITAEFRLISGLARLIEDHPIVTNIVLVLEFIGLAYAIITYDFTTNF